MKFSIENALYTKAWSPVEGRNILTQLINDPEIMNIRPHYFRSFFRTGGAPIPTNAQGVASFTVTAKSPVHTTVADLRAPLGEGKPMEEGESQSYSGSIVDFIAPTWNQTAYEREQMEKLMEENGDETAVLMGYATQELQPRIEAIYSTLDYMAIKAETTGRLFYDQGRGGHTRIYKADIPESNFVKAGAKAWTDSSADVLTSVMNIQEAKWLEWGIEPKMQLKVNDKFFLDVIMKNPIVIDTIKRNWLTDQGQLVAGINNVSNWVVTEENFNRYVAEAIPDFPKITIVKSKQYINGQAVDPWADGVAVLCPVGYAGEILRTNILDTQLYSKYANNAATFTFGTTTDGLVTVMNSTLPNGNLKEWHTKVVSASVPVLTDFPWRVIINTKQAD